MLSPIPSNKSPTPRGSDAASQRRAQITALASVVPDAIHHGDTLPGNDTIAGNGGDDMLVGDQATFYSPLLTGLPTIDNTLDHVQNAFQLAMYSLRTLGIDADQLEHATSTPSQPHDIHLASDQLDGGDGNDRIIGDDLIVIATPTLGLPVASSDFLDDATRLQSYLYDLRTVAADLENVVFEAHYQVLGQLLQAGGLGAEPA